MSAADQGNAPNLGRIRGQLSRARSIWRTSEVLSRGALWTLAVLLAMLVLGGLDNLLRLPGTARLILGVAALVSAVSTFFAWVLRPLFWKISDQAAAVYLERKLEARENLLINAVQLSGAATAAESISKSMVEQIIERAAARAAEMSIEALWDKRRLRKIVLAAFAGAIVFGLYVALLPQYARNAFLRYSQPLAGVPPISNVSVFAAPNGNIQIFAGDKLTVRALTAVGRNTVPEDATIIASVDNAEHRIPMNRTPTPAADLQQEAHDKFGSPASEAGFAYEFPSINKSFTFYIVSGDGESAPCNVDVRERPSVQDLKLKIEAPTYSGLPVVNESSSSGLVHGLQGSHVQISFTPSLPLRSARIDLPGEKVNLHPDKNGTWNAAFEIRQEGTYGISLTSNDGVESGRAFEGQIVMTPDALPTAAFENQSLNLAVTPGTTVPLAVRAQDDLGLKSLRLVMQEGLAGVEGSVDGKNISQIKAWSYTIPGPKGANELYPLKLTTPGVTLAVFAEVSDHCPFGKRIYRTAPLVIRVLTPEQMELPKDSPYSSIFTRIQELIDLQTKTRGKTITVREFLSDVLQKNLFEKRMTNIRDSQVTLQKSTEKLVADLRAAKDEKTKAGAGKIESELQAILQGPMTKAVAGLAGVLKEKEQSKITPAIQLIENAQTEIISRLTILLGTVTGLDREKKDARADLKDDQDSQRLRDKIEEAHEKVKDFLDAQKKIVKSTEELEKKNPDDLTDEDKKVLGDLAKAEKDWAKYFKEAATDLSKVPNQDFSNSKLSEEFNEVFQEIQKASEALQGKNTEIAVKAEEGGLELAKQLETNLEKWLPDTRDTTKWSMEEPKGEFDVPLADLPKELEDIIGELVDDEEKMTDDVQDTSSSWMDSMDKGAGWDAADGNISNMSAKGVTGNRLPNQQEVGGRSGEGRSGKSSGQFVEETADGKGGQQTPTRTTQDPYEQGQVKDTSKDAQGGSTGGGKESGQAAAGLRGTPPPQTLQKMERLKDMQAALRQKAEKVSTQLKAYHLPTSDCEEAVRKMKEIEQKLGAQQGFNLKQAHASVIDSLKESQKVVGFQADVNRERSRDLPKNVRNKIISGMQTKAPEGYQDLMEAYFKSLVEPEK